MPAPTTYDTETELSAVNSILGAIGQSPVTTLGSTTEITGELEYTGNGSATEYSLSSLSFSTEDEIKATLDGVATTAFTITGDKLNFTNAPGNTVAIRIYRERMLYNTFENPEVSFIYNILKESNIDVQNEGWVFNREYHVTFTPNETTKHITIPDNILRIDVKNGWSDKRTDVVKRNGRLYDKVTHSDEFTDATVDCDVVYLFKYEDLPSVFKRYIVAKASTRAATQLVANGELTKLLSQQEGLARASVMEYECNQGNHSMLGLPEGYTYDTYQPYRSLAR